MQNNTASSASYVPTPRLQWAPLGEHEAWKTLPNVPGLGRERFVLQQWWQSPDGKTGEWRNIEKA